jgi:hypothetical protein
MTYNPEYQKKYYQEHKEQYKKSHAKRKDKCILYNRRYYYENKEVLKKYAREYKEKNKEYYAKYYKKYYCENPNIQIVRAMTRHLLKKVSCDKCGSKINLEFHHLVYSLPIKRKDVLVLCELCHSNLHRKPLEKLKQ